MMIHAHQTAPTQFVEANGIRFAYRRFGKAGGLSSSTSTTRASWINCAIKLYGCAREMGAADIEVAEPEINSVNLVEPEPDIDGRHLLGIHIHAGKMQTRAFGLELPNPHDAAQTGEPKEARNLQIELSKSRSD